MNSKVMGLSGLSAGDTDAFEGCSTGWQQSKAACGHYRVNGVSFIKMQ
jgi:hypothetical protein